MEPTGTLYYPAFVTAIYSGVALYGGVLLEGTEEGPPTLTDYDEVRTLLGLKEGPHDRKTGMKPELVPVVEILIVVY